MVVALLNFYTIVSFLSFLYIVFSTFGTNIFTWIKPFAGFLWPFLSVLAVYRMFKE